MNLQHDASLSNKELNARVMVETELNEKLKALRANQEKINQSHTAYYDEGKNQQVVNRYYQNINFQTLNRKELFKALHDLLETTHRNQFNYKKSGHHLETWVDLHPDGQYKSLYSGKQADPVDVIQGELETRIVLNEVSGENGDILNIEHVVPQSWFGKKEPMKGDMHHLFYCEKNCNSFRGNKEYHDFLDFKPEAFLVSNVVEKCGMSEAGEFEPEYGKGIVARATLYFLIRYPNKILPNFKNKINIPLLLQWHADFPPHSEYEKHRNQAIFELQGNRNPFIDFP